MKAIFGPAGLAESFKKMKYKSPSQISDYLVEFELGAFEYQCGRGVKISDDSCKIIKETFSEKDIALSLHAPYYISLSSVEEEKRDKSIDYILQSARAAKLMGAKRVIVHSGSCGKLTRTQALEYSINTISRALEALKDNDLGDIVLCPETMGKVNQLGDLYEVMEICKTNDNLVPCVDFGHLNARTNGGIKDQSSYAEIIDVMENSLGIDRLKVFHSHFSKIEYTEKGGEVRHLTFEDNTYGPSFEELGELVAKKNLGPIFICESAGTQTEDAKTMKEIYEKFL